jgi:hypothetical protein
LFGWPNRYGCFSFLQYFFFHGADLFPLQRTGSFAILLKIDSLHPSPARFSMRRSCCGGHTPPTPTRRIPTLAMALLVPQARRDHPLSFNMLVPPFPCIEPTGAALQPLPPLHPLPCSLPITCIASPTMFPLEELRRPWGPNKVQVFPLQAAAGGRVLARARGHVIDQESPVVSLF